MHCVPTTHLHPFSIPCWADPRSTHCCWVYGHILLQVVWNPSNDHFCPWCHWYWNRMKSYETLKHFPNFEASGACSPFEIWHLKSSVISWNPNARWRFHKNNTFMRQEPNLLWPWTGPRLGCQAVSTSHLFAWPKQTNVGLFLRISLHRYRHRLFAYLIDHIYKCTWIYIYICGPVQKDKSMKDCTLKGGFLYIHLYIYIYIVLLMQKRRTIFHTAKWLVRVVVGANNFSGMVLTTFTHWWKTSTTIQPQQWTCNWPVLDRRLKPWSCG